MNVDRSCHRITIVLSAIAMAFGAAGSDLGAQEKKPPKITFDDHVKPILKQKCFSCHNPDKKSGDLDMTNYTNLMQGGGSGVVIQPGDSSGSYLYQLITHKEEPYMPPESPKLEDEICETIRKWIDGGVLENEGSKALVSTKPKFDLALTSAPTERPAEPPMPARLSLEPVTKTATTTAISALATSPWAPLAAVAGQKQVLLYNTSTLELVGTLPFPEGVPQVLKFSRNGSLLLAGGGRGGASGNCVVWSVKSGERIFEIGDELDAVLAADISSDQTLIALGGPQRIVRIYSTESGRLLHELRKHTDWIYSVEFSPDSVLLATGDRNGGLFVWEGWTGREYLTLSGHTGNISGISWRGDSNIVASSSDDGTIKLWEMNNGSQVKNWGAHGGGAACLEFARDGRILSCGRDRVAKLWNQDGGQLVAFEAFGDLALRVTFCDETNRAIAGDWTGNIRVWNAADGAKIGEITPNPPTLAERLDIATKSLAAAQAAAKPPTDAYQAALTELTTVNTNVTTAQQLVAVAQKKSDDAVAAVAKATQVEVDVTAMHLAATTAEAGKQAELNVLKEALTKAQQAAAADAANADLAAAVVKATADHDAKVVELDAAKKVVAEKVALLETTKKDLATAQQLATTSAAELTAGQEQLAKALALVKPAEEKVAAAKVAADAAAATVVAAQGEVNRWNEAIGFAGKFAELRKQLEEDMKLFTAKQTEFADLAKAVALAESEYNALKSELANAQNAVAAAEKGLQDANAAVAAAKPLLDAATAARTVATTAVTTLESVIAPLDEAAAKTKDAATKAGEDKELVDASAKLMALSVAKKAQLETARATLAETIKNEDAAKVAVAAAEKLVADANARIAASQILVAEVMPKLPPVEGKVAAAKTVAEDSQKGVEAVQVQVNGRKVEIAALQGIKS